jgi:hypothetical protein
MAIFYSRYGNHILSVHCYFWIQKRLRLPLAVKEVQVRYPHYDISLRLKRLSAASNSVYFVMVLNRKIEELRLLPNEPDPDPR